LVNSWFARFINYQIWFDDTVVNRANGEYKQDIPSSSNAWMKVIKSVSISFWDTYDSWDLVYKLAREVNPNTLDYEWTYYLNNQSEDDPIYYLSDNSIFIAPYSDTVVNNWIKVEWIRKIANYDSNTSESNIMLPVEFHYILQLWLMPYALLSKWVESGEVNNAMVNYKNELRNTIKEMWYREEKSINFTYPTEPIIFNNESYVSSNI
jgi:hypothetical protein